MYTVKIHKTATKLLQRIPKNYQKHFKETVKKLEIDPFKLDLERLVSPHQTSHRLRMGAYRIFLNIDTTGKTILILRVVRRSTPTYR